MARDPETIAHQEWLGFVQPVGLVVSIPALLQAQAHINKNIAPDHQRFLDCLPEDEDAESVIKDFPEFTQTVLGWETTDLVGANGTTLPDSLEVTLPEYNETLRPTYAVPEFDRDGDNERWIMLIKTLLPGTDFDAVAVDNERRWQASPHARFERLLRETEVPAGLLFSGTELRLVYAPRGETSGHATFCVSDMAQVAGRPIFAALHMLLCGERLFSLAEKQRLPAILADSRKYQNLVSTKLAEQVLAALYEFLRGFQAADDQRHGELLREVLEDDPNHVYAGLLTTLLRLVFILYAEDRGLLSNDAVYVNHYSVTGLFDRLRADAGRFPDTMDQRFGAWAQLLVLFRLIHDGGSHGRLRIPGRKGYLFDPDRYSFLEGRPIGSRRDAYDKLDVPRVSDGVIFRVLNNLLILDGERLSYRTLDVEQIGSVYETMMGFDLEVATGPSIAIKPAKRHGAPATINLEELVGEKPSSRSKWLLDKAEQKITGSTADALKKADSINDLLAALEKKIAKHATPNVAPKGAMVLQPSDERRRSGSHYTPRSLTEPIVRTTLEPILKALADPEGELPTVYEPSREDKRRYTQGELASRIRLSEKAAEAAKQAREIGTPHPSQILELKICDPAMGSGAFLVETCRRLGDELIKAWYAHDSVPTDIPPDEDEVLYARRLVAQRCLYGVDKNDMAVDLAKLSLWLVTLAKDHPFTFVDHSLRHGDSLVGLTRRQIIGFHWEPKKQKQFGEDLIQKRLDRATEARAKILNAREDVPYRDQEQRLALADEALNVVRMTGDACVSAFFAGSKKKERENRCEALLAFISDWYASGHDINKRGPIATAAAELRRGEHQIMPFHWEIEYPEVFSRANAGFDAFVGNPPFLGGKRISTAFGDEYREWLAEVHRETSSNADLVAHFFRRAFMLIRDRALLGLIATNSIAQGATRNSGLRFICKNGGTIVSTIKRYKWPGDVAVVVSVLHVIKGTASQQCLLDGKNVDRITAFLFHAGSHDEPHTFSVNVGKSFIGFYVLGMGFTFDDADSTGSASSLEEMRELIERKPASRERIRPYIGGSELNSSPTQTPDRYVINFGDMTLDEAKRWPDLLTIVESKVKPERQRLKRKALRERWWQFAEKQPALVNAMTGLERVLVSSQVCAHLSFAYLSSDIVFSHKLTVFPDDRYSTFCSMQSRPHEIWARFFSGTAMELLRYTPSDCFETFPFPIRNHEKLESAGSVYYETRATLMKLHAEGLTDTYNRFHDPDEKSSDIVKLRELHAAMDRAVLDAYGWTDLKPTCEFLLDYEEEEDEPEPGQKLRKKKKPWRYRWPDDFRDEVLARLLDLNQRRAEEERLAGKTAIAKERKLVKRPSKKKTATDKAQMRLGDALDG